MVAVADAVGHLDAIRSRPSLRLPGRVYLHRGEHELESVVAPLIRVEVAVFNVSPEALPCDDGLAKKNLIRPNSISCIIFLLFLLTGRDKCTNRPWGQRVQCSRHSEVVTSACDFRAHSHAW